MSWISEAPPPDYSELQGWSRTNAANQPNGQRHYNDDTAFVAQPQTSPGVRIAQETTQEPPLKGASTMPLTIRNPTPSPQYEAQPEDMRPSTSYPRRLPALPGHGNSGPPLIQSYSSQDNINIRNNTVNSSNSPFETVLQPQSSQPRYPPPSHPPPGFLLPLVMSPERIDTELPPTPSTGYSTSPQAYRVPSRHSVHSVTSSNPGLSAASYRTNDPPPWVVPFLPNELTVTQTNVVTNEQRRENTQQYIPVSVLPDPGHTVSNNYMILHTNKGDKHIYPAYGKDEPIQGYVELKKLKNVAALLITLQGHLTVTYTERGMAHDQTDVRLFTLTKTLYTSQYNDPPKTVHPFEFCFPHTCDASEAPLPPTWNLLQPGVSAEVSYTLRADLKRNLRLNEKLSTKVEYYPRNAPPLPSPRGLRPKLVVYEINDNLPPMGRTGVDKPMVPTPFKAEFILEKPLIYPSGSTIPYKVELSSPMHTVPASLEVVVSLVKVAELTIHGKSYIKEYHIADGENTDKEFLQHRRDGTGAAVLEGGTVIIQGSCLAGTEGSEMSWKVEKVACVKYHLRFVVKPTKEAAQFATWKDSLPSFKCPVDVELTTDSVSGLTSEEASRAAIGLSHQRTRSDTMVSDRRSGPTSPTEEPSELGAFATLPARNRRSTGRPATAESYPSKRL